MSAAELGNSSILENKRTSASGLSVCLLGRRDKASALQCSVVHGQYSTSYEYDSRIRAQRCILAAASGGTALVGPIIVTNGR